MNHRDGGVRIECEQCDKTFTNKGNLKRHMQNKHAQFPPKNQQSAVGDKNLKIASQNQSNVQNYRPEPEERTRDSENVDSPLQKEECFICSDMVILGNDYRCHLNYAHDLFESDETVLTKSQYEEGLFQCEICLKDFRGKFTVEDHITENHRKIIDDLEEDVTEFYMMIRIHAR